MVFLWMQLNMAYVKNSTRSQLGSPDGILFVCKLGSIDEKVGLRLGAADGMKPILVEGNKLGYSVESSEEYKYLKLDNSFGGISLWQ